MTDSESIGDQLLTDALTESMFKVHVDLDLETRKPVNVNTDHLDYNMSLVVASPNIGSVDSNVT